MADVWPSRRFLNGKYSKQLQLLAILARRCFFDMIYILCAIGDASKQISRSICYSEVYIYKLYVYIYMYVCIEGRKVLTVMTGGILQIHSPQHFALCLYGDSDRIQGMWF